MDLSILPMLPPVLPGCTCAKQGAENTPKAKAHKMKRCTALSCRSLFPDRGFGSEGAHTRQSLSIGRERHPGRISAIPFKHVHAAVAGQCGVAAIGCVGGTARFHNHVEIVGPRPPPNDPSATAAFLGMLGRCHV